MDKAAENKIKSLVHSIALKYNLPDETIKAIVDSPYEFTKEILVDVNIPDNITEEEFNKMNRSFRYLSFGTLYLDYRLFKYKMDKRKRMEKINNKKWKN